jgi:glycine cleavage system H protein
MSDLPKDLKYTETHEWIRKESDGLYTVGITDHAQGLLGDIVFIDLPEENSDVDAGDDCCVIESVKAASDSYAPITGKIVEVNRALEKEPELINSQPYGAGWIFKMKSADESEVKELLSADEYADNIEE